MAARRQLHCRLGIAALASAQCGGPQRSNARKRIGNTPDNFHKLLIINNKNYYRTAKRKKLQRCIPILVAS
jgi:hypothetical protein